MGAGAPVAVGNGTLLYIGAAVVVIIWFWAFSRGGYISKDAFQYVQACLSARGMSAEHLFCRFFRRIVSVVTTVLTVAMWLLWYVPLSTTVPPSSFSCFIY